MKTASSFTAGSAASVRAWRFLGLVTALLVTACSSSPDRRQPAELPPLVALMGTQVAWTTQVGTSLETMAPLALGGRVYVVDVSGAVVAINADSGKDVWRHHLGTPLATGAGSDGDITAVITQSNELVALDNGKEVWRVRLRASAFTAPLVAGQRVFVLTADRTVSAFDGRNGARLWTQSRQGEPLVLRQSGVLLPVGDTLVAGLSGRLVGMNPQNGEVRWEAPIATARGTNEVERLVDLVGSVSRDGDRVCARSFLSSVGCVDASRGTLVWTQAAQGSTGLGGDDRFVFGTEADGRVRAWLRTSGASAWNTDRLKYRDLTAPLALGRVVAVGDGKGLVHLLSREDGSEMTRLSTDGSPVIGAPVLAGQVLVVQTRNGGVFAWRPQ